MNKKGMIGLLAATVIVAGGGVGYYVMNDKLKSDQAVKEYLALLEKQDYQSFSKQFSADSLKKNETESEAVENRLATIFSSIGVKDITASDVKNEKVAQGDYQLSYKLNIKTNEGDFKTKAYQVKLSKDDHKDYTFDWQPSLIFPGMKATDKVMIKEDLAERGDILDRNGKKLAENHDYQELGINPQQLGEGTDKAANIKKISETFDVTVKEIEQKLAPDWVQGDVFVPIKVLNDNEELPTAENLPKGVVTGTKKMRYYPSRQASAHLIGYVGEVTEEDIKKNDSLTPDSVIGRTGLERAYDKELRGQDGLSLNIESASGEVKETLFKKDKKEAQDVTTTIDIEAQQKAFASLDNQPGSMVASEPASGDILVATSSPSYDPNDFVLGMSSQTYQDLEKDENLPFLARFSNRYAPGSTFKTLTAGIGLDNGTIKEAEEKTISGLKWQKDSSWGGFWTTRVKDQPTVNLASALVYSDNIYFAQQALQMGEEAFMTGLKKFPFGEETKLPLDMAPASIANEDKLKSDILLADTAYGQGELMISPIDQLGMYSVLMNKGDLVYPKLTEDGESAVKEKVITEKSATTIVNDLTGTVKNEDGYAHNLYQANFNLAAKTGTAEIKEKQDTLGQENSFLLFMDADHQKFMGLVMSEDSRKNGPANEKAADLVSYLEATYQ